MLAEADDLVIPNIFLLDYDATKLGELRVCFGSFVWTRYGGNRLKIAVDLSVVTDVTWTKGWRCQLSLRLQDGSNLKFLGFLEQDAGCLNKSFPNTVKVAALENQMQLTVRNYIELGLNGMIMTFLLGSEQSCEISLSHLAAVHLIRKNCAELETPEERNLMHEIREGEKVTVEIESVYFRLHGGGKDIVSFDNSEACKDGNRFFDMSLQMKAGEENVFMNIRVEEYQNLLKHLKEKQLEVNDMDSKFDGMQITSGLGSFSEPKKARELNMLGLVI